jgi:hypothetical protein
MGLTARRASALIPGWDALDEGATRKRGKRSVLPSLPCRPCLDALPARRRYAATCKPLFRSTRRAGSGVFASSA